MTSILSSGDPNLILISILWLLSNVALMIVTYHTSIRWGPIDPDDNSQICFVDNNSGCFDAGNRVWLFINVIFITLLIISTVWAGELRNQDGGQLKTTSGILILLGGLLLCRFNDDVYSIPFWFAIAYLMIWFGLTLYTIATD